MQTVAGVLGNRQFLGARAWQSGISVMPLTFVSVHWVFKGVNLTQSDFRARAIFASRRAMNRFDAPADRQFLCWLITV